jgi:hypothetical protein
MLGYSKGNAPIGHWSPQGPNARRKNGRGLLLDRIAEAGKGAHVFIWYQGESDSKRDPANYAKPLADLVKAVRAAAGNPDMLVVVVQIGGWKGETERHRFHILRESQRRFVMSDANAVLVPAVGRPLADNVHLAAQSQAELGREIGRAILKVRHKAADVDWPGPVLDEAVIGDDARTVVANFAEVGELKGAAAEDFKVIDAAGEAKCTKASAGKTLVTLTFEREVTLPAKLGYAYEANPAATLRDEAGNHAPAVLIDIGSRKPLADEPSKMPNGAGRPGANTEGKV